MERMILTTTAALGLLMSPALAQGTASPAGDPATPPASATDSSMPNDGAATSDDASGSAMSPEATTSADASGSATGMDDEARDTAVRNAEAAGIQNVRVLDRVFVVEGTTEAGRQVYMIVNPPGALLGIGAPMTAEASAGGSAGVDSTTTSSTTPAAQPPESAYHATQRNPASAQMWDPAMVEGAMRTLGLDQPQ